MLLFIACIMQTVKNHNLKLGTQTQPQTPNVYNLNCKSSSKNKQAYQRGGNRDKQFTQRWQQGTASTSGEERGTGVVGWAPTAGMEGCPPQSLQESGFGDIQKSGHLPAHPCEEEETQREASVCYLPITPQEKRVGPWLIFGVCCKQPEKLFTSCSLDLGTRHHPASSLGKAFHGPAPAGTRPSHLSPRKSTWIKCCAESLPKPAIADQRSCSQPSPQGKDAARSPKLWRNSNGSCNSVVILDWVIKEQKWYLEPHPSPLRPSHLGTKQLFSFFKHIMCF